MLACSTMLQRAPNIHRSLIPNGGSQKQLRLGNKIAAMPNGRPPITVAIVGAGIVGLSLAIGLAARNVRVTVYERASDFREIGAGIAFTGVARRCMELLSPDILEALRRVSNENQHKQDNYWDGYYHSSSDGDDDDAAKGAFPDEQNLLFSLPNGNMAWWGCLRFEFLEELSRVLPRGIVSFGKELASYEDRGVGSGVSLQFLDGSSAECDILIGCDGVNSRVRKQMLAYSHPHACDASYTNKISFRFLVPVERSSLAIGTSKALNHCMHTGPRAHILSYPVAQGTISNVAVFLSTDSKATSSSWGRDDVIKSFEAWRPEVQALLAHMPECPMLWHIYDTADCPAPYYSQGNIAIVGDAAHASAPHHGAGAGFGIEDALALATVLALAEGEGEIMKPQGLVAALEAYNHVRYDRTQWLVRSSRETGDIYEWMYPSAGSNAHEIKRELAARQEKIWNFDAEEIIASATKDFHARIHPLR
ncbi:FAD/NAD(P)-binding domain-containing protein [Xylaria arbuscula]|nr:FAD/NAD(P)-binding domain-containing protein [Xylaria arbuscula]